MEDESAEPVRFELAGENNHQLKQAIRLLKGEDIAQAVQAAAAEAAGTRPPRSRLHSRRRRKR